MTHEELKVRIRLGEDSRTEFKDERADPDALAATIVSFANGAGGDLIIGVGDDRSVRGVSDPDKALLRADSVCRQNIEPPLTHVIAEKHLIDDACLLVVHVPRGLQRPYRTNKGVYYVRGLAGKRMATRQELLEIYQSDQALFPDEMAANDAQPESIDRDYLLSIRPELGGLSETELSQTLVNIKVMFSAEHPTLGGLLCFGKDPQRFRPYARITAIRHKGVEVTHAFLDRREIGGTLETQIRDAKSFVRQHLSESPTGGGATPARGLSIFPFPSEAVDEAIINAVAHRDYLSAAQVRIFVFDDRIEVISPGRLLNSVNVDQMRHGCHVVRNPVIFQHLARLKLAAEAGLGVPTMLTLMRARGLPEPAIVPSGIDLRVTFSLV